MPKAFIMVDINPGHERFVQGVRDTETLLVLA